MPEFGKLPANWSPWIVFFGVVLYGVLHSILASLWVKMRANLLFSGLAGRWYRLSYNIVAVVTLAPVIILTALLPDKLLYAMAFPWNLIALLIQAAALFGLVVGLLQTGVWSFLGLQQLVEPNPSGPPKLVITGLYRYVRHPLYTAGLMLIWFTPRMTVNLLALNLGLTLYIIVGAFFEERKLVHEFGPAYLDYCEQTPMLIPLPAMRWSGHRKDR